MIFPPVYKILKEKVFLQKLQISFSKFISLYSAIIFFGYVISFSLSASSLPTPIDTTNNNLSQNTEISQTIDNASNKENTAEISEEEKLKIEEEKKQQQELVKQQKLEQEENRIKAAKERLNKELEGVRSFDGSGYRDSVDVIIIEVAVFGAYAQIIEEYINDSNEEIKSLAQQLKTEVSKLQSKEFPQIRKAYTDLLGKALWVSNVDVSSKGTYNGTIEFV